MAWKEKIFEEKMTPFIDAIYKKTFSKLSKIKRATRNNDDDIKIMFMDKELAIDTRLFFIDGTILTLQEKTLQYSKRKYNSFTFEYYNDPAMKLEGEWFKLASQLYFFGYANSDETGYADYWIIDIPKLRLFLKKGIGIKTLTEKYLRQNPPPAKANFFAIPFELFENNKEICIIKKDFAIHKKDIYLYKNEIKQYYLNL